MDFTDDDDEEYQPLAAPAQRPRSFSDRQRVSRDRVPDFARYSPLSPDGFHIPHEDEDTKLQTPILPKIVSSTPKSKTNKSLPSRSSVQQRKEKLKAELQFRALHNPPEPEGTQPSGPLFDSHEPGSEPDTPQAESPRFPRFAKKKSTDHPPSYQKSVEEDPMIQEARNDLLQTQLSTYPSPQITSRALDDTPDASDFTSNAIDSTNESQIVEDFRSDLLDIPSQGRPRSLTDTTSGYSPNVSRMNVVVSPSSSLALFTKSSTASDDKIKRRRELEEAQAQYDEYIKSLRLMQEECQINLDNSKKEVQTSLTSIDQLTQQILSSRDAIQGEMTELDELRKRVRAISHSMDIELENTDHQLDNNYTRTQQYFEMCSHLEEKVRIIRSSQSEWSVREMFFLLISWILAGIAVLVRGFVKIVTLFSSKKVVDLSKETAEQLPVNPDEWRSRIQQVLETPVSGTPGESNSPRETKLGRRLFSDINQTSAWSKSKHLQDQ